MALQRARRDEEGDGEEGGGDSKLGKCTEFHFIANKGYSPGQPPVVREKMPAGVYEIGNIGFHSCFIPHEIKTDNLIRIPNTTAELAIKEIDKFWGLREKFKSYGFLHKRGFLLHGPPGTGKTTALNHIMEDVINDDGVVVIAPVAHPGGLISMLRDFREVEPERKVLVVMEDLDNLIRYGETQLLSLLDGEHAIEHVVYVATTNYLDRIPPRIHERPSRFDKKILVGGPSYEARKIYFESRGLPPEKVEELVKYSEGIASMAHLKELIISVEILGNDAAIEGGRLRGKPFPKEEKAAAESVTASLQTLLDKLPKAGYEPTYVEPEDDLDDLLG